MPSNKGGSIARLMGQAGGKIHCLSHVRNFGLQATPVQLNIFFCQIEIDIYFS